MHLNTFILALICSMTTRRLASRLLYAFSLAVNWCFLLDFTGIKLFKWYFSIPKYPRSASSAMELLTDFPMVSLYTLKSCSLPFASCASMICRLFRSIIICVFNVWRFFCRNNSPFGSFLAGWWDFLSHRLRYTQLRPTFSWVLSFLAGRTCRLSLRYLPPIG